MPPAAMMTSATSATRALRSDLRDGVMVPIASVSYNRLAA